VEAVQAGGVTRLDAALLCLAQDRGRGDEVRVAALKTVAPRLPCLRPGLFQYLLGCLAEDKPPLVRLGAATGLAHAPLTEEQLRQLTAAVGRAGPLELARLLPAYERCKSAAVGRQLVDALGRSPGLPSPTADSLRNTLQPYPAEVRELAHPLLKRLDVDADKQAARLAELTPLLHGGDAARGRTLFFSKKMVCTTCHTVAGQGGRVGPDLSHIAATRTGRELLEAVVFPSASFARGYEPYVVATLDGRTFTGIISREAADAIYLVDADRAETRLPRRAVESILPGKVSIMPQGLDTQMTRQELSDLLAFLQGLK
jgi:putative heme-binding domain-containing protein